MLPGPAQLPPRAHTRADPQQGAAKCTDEDALLLLWRQGGDGDGFGKRSKPSKSEIKWTDISFFSLSLSLSLNDLPFRIAASLSFTRLYLSPYIHIPFDICVSLIKCIYASMYDPLPTTQRVIFPFFLLAGGFVVPMTCGIHSRVPCVLTVFFSPLAQRRPNTI